MLIDDDMLHDRLSLGPDDEQRHESYELPAG